MVNISQVDLSQLAAIHNAIPELDPVSGAEFYQTRIADKGYIALVASIDGKAVGFKLGYWLDDSCFYSWLGGVLPEHRAHHIAKLLMLEQEKLVQAGGANEIRVKSMNRYRGMMVFLLKQGYDIVGFDYAKGKIHFSKRIRT